MRQTRVASDDFQIKVNEKGDTVMLVSYKTQDVVNILNDDLSKLYKGTPFFKNGWYKGKIWNEQGRELSFVMAYNIERSEVYFSTGPMKEAINYKPNRFWLEGHTFELIYDKFYEPIYLGQKGSLMKLYLCQLELKQPSQRIGYESSGSESEYEGVFVKSAKYYWRQGKKLCLFSNDKRTYRLFGDKRTEVQTYATARGLNLKNEQHLIEIFRYFDSL
ncbi:MAG: hypothetical protein ACK4GN_14770 [Runella sp.]